MRPIRAILIRFAAFFCPGNRDSDFDSEMQSHLAMHIEDNLRSGMTPQQARREALLKLGGLEQTKELYRDRRSLPFLETLLQDLRFGARTLRRSPGFAVVAILTMALGIGVNAAIFGLLDSTLLSISHFRQPERLVRVWTTDAGGDLHTPLPAQYAALRQFSHSFEQVSGTGWGDNFYGSDESGWQNLPGLLVSSNWLPTLGIQPLLGRNFLDEEHAAGRDTVVMLFYSCWRTRFHGDPNVVGKQMVLNRRTVTVVGVLPQSMGAYYGDVDILAPLVLASYESLGRLRVAGSARVRIVARLKLGVTLEQARSETETIAAGLRGVRAPTDRGGHLVVEDFAEEFRHPGPTRQNARRGLWIMAAAAGVVLLIACANVASLLLARGVKRHREVALRSALGCSRARMIRQLLTESALLFVCGGSLGLLAARWSAEIITKIVSGVVSNTTYLEVNPRVFAACMAASLLCALLFGMIPALHATRVSLNDSLKDAIPSTTSSSGSRRSRNLLVVFQIALGMTLLVGFGLLFRSLLRVESAPFGFDPRNVLTATATLPVSHYADPSAKARLMQDAVARVRSMPGVESAGLTDSLPMNGADSARLQVDAPSSMAAPMAEEIWFLSVGPEYFSALKIPMFAGRAFQDQDTRHANPVAIVNRTFANFYFPGVSPIGYHVAFADSPTIRREIVGIVSDFRQRNPEEDLRPLVYLPVAQTLPGRVSMAIRLRAANDLANVGARISNSLGALDAHLYWEMGSMQRQIFDSESLTMRRPIIALAGSFGGLALILVVVGVFGVTSYSVAERTRELGIRLALGAPRREIAGLVLRESLRVTLAGLAVGTFGACAMTRLFPTGGIGWSGSGIFLYGVSRTDSLTYLLAAALLTSVVLVASWAPARRAMRVDPVVALRYE